ncbi:hypothetical protein HIJ87_08845 [Cronobacter malonaticus]|uniref:hypothetical protein n=1 Tax=Cronobacter malonaticus TaxID=413503 RepID=UPI001889E1C6|nr:hypothetical protein [Cronobacter malonaticus]MBF4662022.1 hypothetical protein [Cronobacter malonaticus]MBF4834728.1 hypothetical protein [Cronobacter malonaticus]MBF4846389.1 hypothetical protein [Cronobacter malonaticus]MBF4848878.1 hypothetical protein [Cronobacter malonaticus]MBF4862114.1 hypothetical protein [Cronobacter malonaticus]
MERFEWITRAFAQSSNVQKSLFPDFVNVADELAVEWEIALEETDYEMLSDKQKLSIKAFDDYLLSISGLENIHYWNDDALCYSSEWNKMRELAKIILDSMGWVNEAPPECNAIYISNK